VHFFLSKSFCKKSDVVCQAKSQKSKADFDANKAFEEDEKERKKQSKLRIKKQNEGQCLNLSYQFIVQNQLMCKKIFLF